MHVLAGSLWGKPSGGLGQRRLGRTCDDAWHGSLGFQVGGSETDVIMLVMNRRGMDRLLGDRFTIGADAAAAAGLVGLQVRADTDVGMRAEILSWSRSRGLGRSHSGLEPLECCGAVGTGIAAVCRVSRLLILRP